MRRKPNQTSKLRPKKEPLSDLPEILEFDSGLVTSQFRAAAELMRIKYDEAFQQLAK
jgi:hypothetical protein